MKKTKCKCHLWILTRRTCGYGYFYTCPMNPKWGITPLSPPVSVTQQNASELSVTFIAFRKSERNVSTFAHCNSCYHFNICIVMLWKERVVDISYIFSGTCLWSNLSVQFAHIFLSIASSLNDVLAEKLSKMNISEPRLSGGRRGSKNRKQPNMLKQNIRSAFKVCDKETGQTGISEYSLLTFLWCFLLQQSVKDQAMHCWGFWSLQ